MSDPRTGPAAVMLMLAGACALMVAATTPVRASTPSPSLLATLPVVLGPTPSPAAVQHRSTTPPVVPPAPRPAPVAASPAGAVQGIEVPNPGLLPPVAVLTTPATASGSGPSVVPLGLLAALAATLLIATGLTARRRL